MSHSLYVQLAQPPAVEALLGVILVEGLAALEADFPAAGPWPAGISHWHRPGASARSTEIEYDEGQVRVRILAGSSPADYILALRFAMGFAHLAGSAIAPEDDEPLALADFRAKYDAEWAKGHASSTLKMVLSQYLRGEHPSIQLTTLDRTLHAGPRLRADLLREPKRIAHRWFDKIQRFNYPEEAGLFQPQVMVVEREGVAQRITTYAPETRSLLWERAELVALYQGDDDGLALLPFERLVALLGERAEWISEDLLDCPALDMAAWASLLEAARPHLVVEAGGPPASDNAQAEQWLLQHAPGLIFLLVAGVDGRIDDKERQSLQREIQRLAAIDNPFGVAVRDILPLVQQAPEQYLQQVADALQTGDGEPLEQLAAFIGAVGSILDAQLDNVQARYSKQQLYNLGHAAASASGGLFGKISREEQAALDLIKALYRL
ncbi:hypothetical protein [Chitinolyticbacter meiyuanensis]|uniref:hypothetical protein n=1 Tax=Chitinolyticbacter meiyuanensis TaxID=682798 RepID=UPI0011E5F610|nr:hypothetical protein [Chitinolyticbacter meiyuanensis]